MKKSFFHSLLCVCFNEGNAKLLLVSRLIAALVAILVSLGSIPEEIGNEYFNEISLSFYIGGFLLSVIACAIVKGKRMRFTTNTQ